MKKLFTLLIIAIVAFSVNAAGVMICGKVYNENSYQLINQELTDAGYLKSGSLVYDPVNYKLTLNNADIRMEGKGAIVAAGELKIKVLGNNNYIAVNNLGEYAGAAIQTAGTLSIFAPSDATEFSKLQIVCGAAPAFYA